MQCKMHGRQCAFISTRRRVSDEISKQWLFLVPPAEADAPAHIVAELRARHSGLAKQWLRTGSFGEDFAEAVAAGSAEPAGAASSSSRASGAPASAGKVWTRAAFHS